MTPRIATPTPPRLRRRLAARREVLPLRQTPVAEVTKVAEVPVPRRPLRAAMGAEAHPPPLLEVAEKVAVVRLRPLRAPAVPVAKGDQLRRLRAAEVRAEKVAVGEALPST